MTVIIINITIHKSTVKDGNLGATFEQDMWFQLRIRQTDRDVDSDFTHTRLSLDRMSDEYM